MRYRIWLLVLVVAMGLACAKPEEKASNTSPLAAATATPPFTFTLKVTFEGLVGYVNTSDWVWALLPKAQGDTMPIQYHPNELREYPEHYAFLKVNGENIQDYEIAGEIYIPIAGKEIWITDQQSTGSGIPPGQFEQPNTDVDRLNPDVLTKNHPNLTTRVRLPRIDDWIIDVHEYQSTSIKKFVTVKPELDGSYCKAPPFVPTGNGKPRVQAVTWQKHNLTDEIKLTIRTLGGFELKPLVLVPVTGQNTIQISIVNKMWQALYDPDHPANHWPSYRWFYNLSADPKTCIDHYYPQGDAGGNRCPQKLYSE